MPTHKQHTHTNDIAYPEAIPFIGLHLACFAAIWTGVTATDLWIAFALYWVRMFGITAGYHRYFSHKAFKTSRPFQFVLAWLGGMSLQQGALWWAAIHRHHHRYSDTEHDVHSPRQHGFWFSHVGWVFAKRNLHPDYHTIRDLTKYPELKWLDKHHYVPGVVTMVLLLAFRGWGGVVVGFIWSTVVLYHCVFMINSLAHVHGRRRFHISDDSRNNPLLAVIAMGEGWHNNHHYYQVSVRQGFYWWEIDVSYYILRALAAIGLVWDLRLPPAHLRQTNRQRHEQFQQRLHDLSIAFQNQMDVAQEQWLESKEQFRKRIETTLQQAHGSLSERVDDMRHTIDDAIRKHQLKLQDGQQSFDEARAKTLAIAEQRREQLLAWLDDIATTLEPIGLGAAA